LSGFIPEDIINRVRDSVDIVGLVSRYLSLKKAGASFKALCPFHKEKTPSFIVTPSRQTFKCFGCGKGGNVFHFVMAMDRVSFPEAVRTLAKEAGVEVPEARKPTPAQETARTERELLYDANRRAADFYAKTLASAAGQAAREYVEARGISDEMTERCCLGYSPDSWEALIRAAGSAGIATDVLCKAGLAIQRDDGSCYDRFRDRLIFPIFDAQERVIGLGARTMGDSEVKYINTPETPIFSKGRNLYGLNWARKAIVDHKRAAVVEGYTDVIMAHQHGCMAVVATLGTALTREHIQVLRRFAERIDVVFDSDAAGQQAAERSMELFLNEGAGEFLAAGFDVRMAALEGGNDPCDLIAAQGADAFVKALDAGDDVVTRKIKIVSERYDASTVDGKTKAVDDVLGLVAVIPNAVGRQLTVDAAVRKLSDAFGLEDRVVRARLGQLERRTRRRPGAAEEPARAAVSYDPAELGVIEAILAVPDLAGRIFDEVAAGDFSNEALRSLFQMMKDAHDSDGTVHGEQLLGALQDTETASLVSGVLSAEPRTDVDQAGLDCVRALMKRRLHQRIQAVKKEIEAAKDRRHDDAWAALVTELNDLNTELQREVLAL